MTAQFFDARLPPSFWSKCIPEPNSGCWLWFAAHYTAGYGVLRVEKVLHSAHRLAYTVLVGSIPDGLVLDHRCLNTACVNPEHLRAVTQAENVLAGQSPFARNARKTRCPRGHVYDRETSGGRRCRRCDNDSTRRWVERTREAG